MSVFFKWLFIESWYFSIPIYVLIVPFFLPDFFIRYYLIYGGILLRVVGFVFIIYGFNKKLKNFTDGGIEGLFIKWFDNRPYKGSPANIQGSANMKSSAKAQTEAGWNFDKFTIDEKVEFLINYIGVLEKKVFNFKQELKDDLEAVKSKVDENAKQLNDKLREIEQRMTLGFVGNVEKEFFGAVTIIIGVIFTSIPDELIYLYHA